MKYRLRILSGLRIRHLLVSFALLIIILIAMGYFSIRAGRETTLDSLVEQGKALTTVLTASAANIIETDRQISDLAIDKILSDIALYKEAYDYESGDDFLESLAAQLGSVRSYILDSSLNVLNELKTEPRGMTEELDSLFEHFLNSAEIDKPFDIIYDRHAVGERWFLFCLLPHDDRSYLAIVIPWIIGQYADNTLSLAYLLNQLSQEAGIEYIMLQNLDGIVFASKQISQTPRIKDDPFLSSVLEADTARSRVIDFQDREILEVVQTFNSGEEFYGLFRVGLSLYAHRQLTSGFQKQVWLFVAILVVLGVIGVVIVAGYQNLNLTEEALKRAEAITRSLQDSIPGIVLSTDENLKIITANSEARKHFGLPAGPPHNWDYDNYFTGDPFKVKTVLNEKRPVSFETQIKGSSGMMQLLVSTSTLYAGRSRPTGVVVVAHDISEKRALERHAQQSHRLSELGTVAAGLAHDIRNPLNAMGMVVQRLANEVEVQSDKDEFKEFIDTLKAEHVKLNATIEKILQVARSSRLEMKEVEVKPLIDDVIALYRYEASEHGIEIKSDVEDGRVYVNELTFKNIISNLIKNAIEVIKDKGLIELRCYFDANRCVIRVTDDGPGIPADQITNLFKPFFTTKAGGTGLGLATAYKSAVDHGGELKVESKPGGPTIFSLIIPAERK